MKVLDVPQVGKLGLTVTWPGRNGLIRRTYVIPSNPQTLEQLQVRSNLGTQANAWKSLTDAQQDAWIAAAAQIQSRPTLGQSGPLTGLQLFTKVNCNLLTIGGAAVTDPPAVPVFTPLPIDALDIANAAGVITVRLHTTDSPPDGTELWGAPPQSAGTRRATRMNYLGTLDSPVSNYITITTPITAKFGALAAGQRLFVQVVANINGFKGVPLSFNGRVPAAA